MQDETCPCLSLPDSGQNTLSPSAESAQDWHSPTRTSDVQPLEALPEQENQNEHIKTCKMRNLG